MKYRILIVFVLLSVFMANCRKNQPGNQDTKTSKKVFYEPSQFAMGVDLSYLNQILDLGGTYKDSGQVKNPYLIFKENGANVARFRLFHNPVWTKEVYGIQGKQMYNDYEDVKRAISQSKNAGMQVCLDFHYSDTWADPGKQIPPAAWDSLSLQVLTDSIYNYTIKVLDDLGEAGLMPEFVQVGNEINPGFILPYGNRWNGNTISFVSLLNAGIQAVWDAGAKYSLNPKVILHIAQPENVLNWFDGLAKAGLKDFDIIGFSYYYIWSDVPLDKIHNYVAQIKKVFQKEVMIMETAYPWTTENADNYPNIINDQKLDPNFPATPEGQYKYLVKLTQEVIDGGGTGLFYWEPGWITSDMKTQWGQGSAWDCNTFFDFEGNALESFRFMTKDYHF